MSFDSKESSTDWCTFTNSVNYGLKKSTNPEKNLLLYKRTFINILI